MEDTDVQSNDGTGTENRSDPRPREVIVEGRVSMEIHAGGVVMTMEMINAPVPCARRVMFNALSVFLEDEQVELREMVRESRDRDAARGGGSAG